MNENITASTEMRRQALIEKIDREARRTALMRQLDALREDIEKDAVLYGYEATYTPGRYLDLKSVDDAEALVRALDGADPNATVHEIVVEALQYQAAYWSKQATLGQDALNILACDVLDGEGMQRHDTGYGERFCELTRHAQARAEGTVPLEVRAATA